MRPGQDIEAALTAFYATVQAPVATDLRLLTEGATLDLPFPAQLPDLYVGSQLSLTARYTPAEALSASLEANVGTGAESFELGGALPHQSVRHMWLPRLWASRLMGELLYAARENGGEEETVEEIRQLARRYGFVTRWTPFQADANGRVSENYSNPTGMQSGDDAVGTSSDINSMIANNSAGAYAGDGTDLKLALDRAFLLVEGVWTDTSAEGAPTVSLRWGTRDWRRLLHSSPQVRELMAVGRDVVFRHNCTVVRVSSDAEQASTPLPAHLLENPEERFVEADGVPAPPVPKDEEGGCAQGGGGPSPWLLVLVLGLGMRRRARFW